MLLVALPSLTATGFPLQTDPSLDHVARAAHGSGSGLWVRDGYAYSSAQSSFSVIDVRDPADPQIVSTLSVRARDVDLLDTDDGRRIAVLADGGPYIHFVDVTDPTAPTLSSTLTLAASSHNIAVYPNSTLVYNSRSGASGIDIIDAADPSDPQVVTVWRDGSLSCHDVTLYAQPPRAYCAALGSTYILDTTDPLQPVVLERIVNDAIQIHHWAIPSWDHSVLIIGDEAFSGDNGCEEALTTPVGTVSAESGAVWFYDLTKGDPAVIGHVSAPQESGFWCTAHFGDIIGETTVAVGWYAAGVLLIEWGDPIMPRIVHQWQPPEGNANVWDVRLMDGHLYTGDLNRGLDVLKLVPGQPLLPL